MCEQFIITHLPTKKYAENTQQYVICVDNFNEGAQ